jgi:tripartite-type tricarboxylate transporter receptor subunit TctC
LRTPPEIIAKLNFELVKVLKNPELQERLFTVGAEAVGSTPAEFAAFLHKDSARWTKVLRDSGAKTGQ